VLLLCPAVVAAGAVAVVWCLWVAYEWVQQRRNRSTAPVQSVRAQRGHYLVLYVVLTLFFLYPQVGFGSVNHVLHSNIQVSASCCGD
jgi:uncharacterized membrane protein